MVNQILAVSVDELNTRDKHQQARDAFVKLGGKSLEWLGKWEDRQDYDYIYLVKDLDGDILWWEDYSMIDTPATKILTFQELLDLAYPKAVSKDTSWYVLDWYDYDKQEAVAFPPVGEKVLYSPSGFLNNWVESYVVANHFYRKNTVLISNEMLTGNIYYIDNIDRFKPLDFDKNDKAKKEREDLIEVIASAGNLSIGVLADIILASGYKREVQ